MVGTKMQQKGFLCVLLPEKKSVEMTDINIFGIFKEAYVYFFLINVQCSSHSKHNISARWDPDNREVNGVIVQISFMHSNFSSNPI